MKLKSCQKGQTSVEYILLVGVMIFISIAFFKQVRDYMVRNPDSVINRYLGGFDATFNSANKFKTFRLAR